MSLVMQDLTVPVEIPQMQVVHTARLRRLVEPSDSPQLDSIPIGQGIPMELAISHTRSWDGEQLRRAEGQTLDFCFEVQANPEVWIVGGQRRAHFSSQVSTSDGMDHASMLTLCTGERGVKIRAAPLAPENRTSGLPVAGDPLP